MKTTPRTPSDVYEEFRRRGVTISEWARQNGVLPQTVFDLLHGKSRGHRGMSHRAAVLLGLKDGVIEPLPAPSGLPPPRTPRKADHARAAPRPARGVPR